MICRGQTAGDMRPPAQDDLGVVLPQPLSTFVAVEPAAHPHQLRYPTLSGEVLDLEAAAVTHPGRP